MVKPAESEEDMTNKIAYVKENHLQNKITWVVMFTDFCISSARFYEGNDLSDLPVYVIGWIKKHERKIFDDNRYTKSFIYE